MWSGLFKRAEPVEAVIGNQRGWLLGAASEQVEFSELDQTLAALEGLADRTPIRIWLTGALTSTTVVDPASSLATSEWSTWLQYMAVQSFGAASGPSDSDDWVLWCSSERPMRCRLSAMRSSLFRRLSASCGRLQLLRVAPLWASLEDGVAVPPAGGSNDVCAFDGEQAHWIRQRSDGQCEEHSMRDCDWNSCFRWYRRRHLAQPETASSLWRWLPPIPGAAVSMGWNCIESA